MKISAREIAVVAIFAALSWIACKFIPGIPIIGAEGSKISWDVSLAPIYGIVIGPYLGFAAAVIGGLAAAGSLFTVLTSFCTGISAFVTGMLTDKNKKKYGWIIAAAVIGLLLLGWYSTEVGRKAPFYPILHTTGLLIIISTRGWIADRVAEGKTYEEDRASIKLNMRYIALGIILLFAGSVIYFRYGTLVKVLGESTLTTSLLSFSAYTLLIIGALSTIYGIFSWVKLGFMTAIALACYCGIIADHMLGNLIFLGMVDIVAPALKGAPSEVIAGIFMSVLPISAVERTLFTAIATIIAAALIPTLRSAGITYRKDQ
ncbi:MAG: hypothetical protein QXR17_02450 [Candidatus Bathyarchaeia archaeon]